MDSRPARTLLHYRLEAELGRGGMGVVYRAHDAKLRRPVAIKVLPPDLVSDPGRRKRFLREARTAAAVNHPNIATIHEVGEADGTAFIVMELVEGRTLRSLIRSGSLGLSGSLKIAVQVASGLARAHRAGIIHRDLKPDNVMVGLDGHVKILDFGLAKPIEEGAASSPSAVSQLSTATGPVTREGKIVGTAAYMSPEQAKGERLDARTDVFSFGTMLFEMVTGRLPFKGGGPMETLSAIIKDDPPGAAEINPEVPESVATLIGRCLRKSTAERFASAEELAREFGAVLERPPGPAGGGGRGAGVSTGSGRVPRRLLAASILTAAVAVAVTLALRGSGSRPTGVSGPPPAAPGETAGGPPPPIQSVAVLPFEDLSEEPVASQHISYGLGLALTTKLNVLAGLRVAPWMTSRRYRGPDIDPREVADELRVQGLLIGSYRSEAGRISGSVSLVDSGSAHQVWTWEFDEASTDIVSLLSQIATRTANELKGSLSGEEQAEMARPVAASAEAWELYMRGATFAQANTWETFDMALGFFERALALDPELAPAHVGVGSVHTARYFFGWDCGQECLETAERSFNRALAIEPLNAEAMAGLVHVYWHQRRVDKCLQQGAEAVRKGGERVEYLSALAEAYLFCGLPGKGLGVLDQILEIDAVNQRAWWYRTFAMVWSGNYEMALKAADDYFERFGDDPEVHYWTGVAYACMDELEPAVLHMDTAIELFGEDTNHYAFGGAASVHRQLRETETAREIALRGVEITGPVFQRHPDNVQIGEALADLYAVLGDRESFERVYSALPMQDPFVLGVGYAMLGDRQAALDAFERGSHVTEADRLILDYGFLTCDPAVRDLKSEPEYEAFRRNVERLRGRLEQTY